MQISSTTQLNIMGTIFGKEWRDKHNTGGLEDMEQKQLAATNNALFKLNYSAPTYEVAQQSSGEIYGGWSVNNTVDETSFINFKRVPPNGQGQTAGDKFHISVAPQDVTKAYDILSKLLTAENSPIDSWKVTDMGRLTQNTAGERRISQGAQFTLYPKPDRADGTYSPEYMGKLQSLVKTIEQELRGAGIGQSEHKPASDVSAQQWQYASYRNANRSDRQGSPDQSDALKKEPFFKLISSAN
ncbi:type III effector [uncultured Pseudomonas sp.]|uniref:type III effector n=1 Tax=uncultured Pseudomonas sp. TaxID=114707 RepID=UPI0025D976A8|nr:type III effector [uncultured Pseudomonas sp.]